MTSHKLQEPLWKSLEAIIWSNPSYLAAGTVFGLVIKLKWLTRVLLALSFYRAHHSRGGEGEGTWG